MAFFLQQQGQNLVISKEIITLFQTDRFELLNLSNNDSEQRTFVNKLSDFVYQPRAKDSSMIELRIFLFNRFLPLERLYFNLDDLDKTIITLPEMEKRDFEKTTLKEEINISSLKEEFRNQLKEKINYVLAER